MRFSQIAQIQHELLLFAKNSTKTAYCFAKHRSPSLGSISSTPGEHCIEYSRGELGNDVRGGAVRVIFCDGASKNNATGKGGYEGGLAHSQDVCYVVRQLLAVEQVASMKARWAFKHGAA